MLAASEIAKLIEKPDHVLIPQYWACLPPVSLQQSWRLYKTAVWKTYY